MIGIFKNKFMLGVPGKPLKNPEKPWKTIEKTINHSAFESTDYGLSNYVLISKSIFLRKIAVFLPGGGGP